MRVRRRPATDVLVRDGETAVLVDGMVIRLSLVSSLLYAECPDVATTGHLAQALTKAFGVPPDRTPLEATEQIIEELLSNGLLEQVSD